MFGASTIRGAIIRTLAEHPAGMTSGAIERELQVTYLTALRHLQALVGAGAVTTDGDVRAGRRTVYTLNADHVRQALAEYQQYLLAEDSSRDSEQH